MCSYMFVIVLIFSRSTDVTSTDLVSAKGETNEVYCCEGVSNEINMTPLIRIASVMEIWLGGIENLTLQRKNYKG